MLGGLGSRSNTHHCLIVAHQGLIVRVWMGWILSEQGTLGLVLVLATGLVWLRVVKWVVVVWEVMTYQSAEKW